MNWAAVADTELMQGLQSGSTDCMSVLCDRHWERLVVFVQGIVRNRAAAEEIAQESFLRVYLSRHRYEPTARFTTWLYRIATNRALNFLRDHRHEAGLESLDQPGVDGLARQVTDLRLRPDEAAESNESRRLTRQRVIDALESLPARQRRAVVLHRYHELSYEQISRELNCTVPSVKSLLWRAYSALRTALEAKQL
ncbi:MAG: sigma-70 family RNA polymerase sigma factor [Bryobacterales bacterium]|nr:sigma-70 family RNA polymerase sigma factor [Bryobacterales bacterium]